MSKAKTHYVCQNCGHQNTKWLGRCPSCQSWNTFEEEKVGGSSFQDASSSGDATLAVLREEFKSFREQHPIKKNYYKLEEISEKNSTFRYQTGLSELDRVLGGGLVPDAFTLLGGDPGIGKSTLLLQLAQGLLKNERDFKILYVSGEESLDQIRARAKRLGIETDERLFLAAETQLEKVFASVQELKPNVLLMDSLQTFTTIYSQSSQGSVSQVREISARLMMLAKSAGLSVWLVGHVTKEGSIAGPKVIEHMVDTVLYFEGEQGQSYRLLRTVKNRFGNTNELGVFEMDTQGLVEVLNPSSLFLSERTEAVSGTAITASLEGSRPLLVELQALTVSSPLAIPRRTAQGIDHSRLTIVTAILEKHLGLPLAHQDLFFNVAGGLKLTEPSMDLAIAAAIWSSVNEKSIPSSWLFLGELALTGEIRKVSNLEVRLQEAKKLGFTTVVMPQSASSKTLSSLKGMKFYTLSKIKELPSLLA